ncbi:hypothetical protein [Nocardioides bruguierae]|uniref:hypothetical protein n=1 Tax=Nocardioides bruguierae TaxID=2945102 RepID=UPI00202194F5|nr:hypothetical protein [Nocardioides bruguierae]MCL8025978.1 hypothetical protein [Nocardioides bruguierae]
MTTLRTTRQRSSRHPGLRAVAVAAVLPTALLLAGCSGSDEEASGDSSAAAEESAASEDGAGSGDYCADLTSTQEDLSGLSGDDPASLDQAFTAFDTLAAEAPDEVAEQWTVLTDMADQVRTALDENDLTLEDLSTLSTTGQLPEGVTQEQVIAVGEELSSLTSAKVSEAASAISVHAQSECGITLGQG